MVSPTTESLSLMVENTCESLLTYTLFLFPVFKQQTRAVILLRSELFAGPILRIGKEVVLHTGHDITP